MSDFSIEARMVCDQCGQSYGLWHKGCDGSWVTETRRVTPWTREPQAFRAADMPEVSALLISYNEADEAQVVTLKDRLAPWRNDED